MKQGCLPAPIEPDQWEENTGDDIEMIVAALHVIADDPQRFLREFIKAEWITRDRQGALYLVLPHVPYIEVKFRFDEEAALVIEDIKDV